MHDLFDDSDDAMFNVLGSSEYKGRHAGLDKPAPAISKPGASSKIGKVNLDSGFLDCVTIPHPGQALRSGARAGIQKCLEFFLYLDSGSRECCASIVRNDRFLVLRYSLFRRNDIIGN
jgi:hypothetical protein